MFESEAIWISRYLNEKSIGEIGTVLNLGSSTLSFRETTQPYINLHIFDKLEYRGINVIHTDIKQAAGVDIVANILRDDDLQLLQSMDVNTVICSNLLEHIKNWKPFLARIDKLVPLGGALIITSPLSYPYHPDPIDNLFRPTIKMINQLLPNYEVIKSDTLECGNFISELRNRPTLIPRVLLRLFLPFYKFQNWKGSIHKLLWLFRNYKQTCVVLKKTCEY